jgi:hypothetical protein
MIELWDPELLPHIPLNNLVIGPTLDPTDPQPCLQMAGLRYAALSQITHIHLGPTVQFDTLLYRCRGLQSLIMEEPVPLERARAIIKMLRLRNLGRLHIHLEERCSANFILDTVAAYLPQLHTLSISSQDVSLPVLYDMGFDDRVVGV